MPHTQTRLSFEKQKQHWLGAYQKKNWKTLKQLLNNTLYNDFIKSQDALLPDIVWEAYQNHQLQEFAESLLKKIDSNIFNQEDETLLFKACEAKNESLIRILLQNKANPLLETLKNYEEAATILEYVVWALDFKSICLFIEYFNNYPDHLIWQQSIWEDAACQAIYNHNDKILKTLLMRGVNPNTSFENETLLYKACRKDNADLVHLLLQYQTDLHFIESEAEPSKFTNNPLDYALEHCKLNIISLFLQYLNTQQYCFVDQSKLQKIAYRAIFDKDYKILETLLKHGIDPNTRCEGVTLLYCACEEEDPNSIRLLLQYKADPNLKGEEENIDGAINPWHYVLREQNTNIALIIPFIELYGAKDSLNKQDQDGNTLLHIIIAQDNHFTTRLVPILLQNGAHPNIQNKQGDTPLHLAVQCSDAITAKTVTEALFLWGADVDVQNNNHQKPIALTSRSNSTNPEFTNIIYKLLEKLRKKEDQAKQRMAPTTTKAARTYLRFTRSLSNHDTSWHIVWMILSLLNGVTLEDKKLSPHSEKKGLYTLCAELRHKILLEVLIALDADIKRNDINQNYDKLSHFKITDLISFNLHLFAKQQDLQCDSTAYRLSKP